MFASGRLDYDKALNTLQEWHCLSAYEVGLIKPSEVANMLVMFDASIQNPSETFWLHPTADKSVNIGRLQRSGKYLHIGFRNGRRHEWIAAEPTLTDGPYPACNTAILRNPVADAA